MVRLLKRREIDGFLLDRYTLWSIIDKYTDGSEEDAEAGELISFIGECVLTSVEYTYELLSYGMLVRDQEDFEFLHNVIRSARFRLEITYRDVWNKAEHEFFHKHKPGLFDAEQPYFKYAAIVLSTAIALISMIGIVFERLCKLQCCTGGDIGGGGVMAVLYNMRKRWQWADGSNEMVNTYDGSF